MQQSYQICSQNDVDRRGGMQDAFITVGGPFFVVFFFCGVPGALGFCEIVLGRGGGKEQWVGVKCGC